MKTSAKFTGLTTIATALAVTLALTGCVGTTVVVPSPASSSNVTPSADPTSAPDILEGVEFGDELTPEQAAAVEGLQDGSHAYRLADGTYVLTSYKAPLSDTVKADVAARIDSETVTRSAGQ